MDENERIEETVDVEETENETVDEIEETEPEPAADYSEILVKLDSLDAKIEELAAAVRTLSNSDIPPAAADKAIAPATLY